MSEEKPPIVTLLKGDGSKDNLAELIRHIEANWPQQEKIATCLAREKKMQYDAYIKVGFTSEQAMLLIK